MFNYLISKWHLILSNLILVFLIIYVIYVHIYNSVIYVRTVADNIL